MRKITILIVAAGILLALYIAYTQKQSLGTLSKDEAITLIQQKYPEYKDYPSNNLPPKSIEAVPTEEGWRVGMYVEGSGVAGILKANCFLVSKSRDVTETGLFQGEGPAKTINLLTCTPKD